MTLAIALEIDGAGAHPAARAVAEPGAPFDPVRLRRTGEMAERAGFTAVTLDDDLVPGATTGGRIGAIERAAFLAEVTNLVGLIPVVSTTYTEPFHVSSSLAALDHISHGRAGWIVTTSPDAASARAWGRTPVTSDDDLRREAADAVRVARALWDSWEDDAVIRDVSTSRYLDRDRVHYVDFAGETYSVKGPAVVPRPPQGHAVVLGAPGTIDSAAVDVALVAGRDVDTVAAAATRVGTGAPRTFAEVEVALDTPEASGGERLAALDRIASWPDRERLRFVGSPDGLVALLGDLARHVDGVRLHPLLLDEDLGVLSRRVLPRLSVERVAAPPIAGRTLRATLGLVRPDNQFTSTSTATPTAGATR